MAAGTWSTYTVSMPPAERPTTERPGEATDDVDTSAIAEHLDSVRADLDRVEPADLAAEVAAGAYVVDIRPTADRARDGELPGALVIERIHLEWRVDPTSAHRIPGAIPGRKVILVCNEGYSSSLAAARLQELGVDGATDLTGGARAWFAWRDRR